MEGFLVGFFLFIIITTLLCFLLTSVSLFRIANYNKASDTRLLGLSYISMVVLLIYFVLADTLILFNIITFTVYMFADNFIHNAFYKDRKCPVKYIILIHFSIAIIRTLLYIYYIPRSEFDLVLSIIGAVLAFGWLGVVSKKTHRYLKEYQIQPWVRKRAAIVSYSSCIGMLVYVPDLFSKIFNIPFQDTTNTTSLLMFGLSFMCLFIFAVGQYFAWLMPEWFKRRLNRKFSEKQQIIEELSEAEIETQMSEGGRVDV